MAVDVRDLPPDYQVQALKKLMEREREKRRANLPAPAPSAPGGGRKYHNKPTERVTAAGNVLRFDSQKEARRYDELLVMLQAGKIRDLKLQPQFTLQEAYTDSEGVRTRAIRYQADFTYVLVEEKISGETFRDQFIVEDVKSRATRTKEYILKRKLMKERFGIEIREV